MPAPDLSLIHQPVSQLFPATGTAADNQFRLSDQQIESFHRDGYVAGIQVLQPDAIEQLKQELAEFVQPDHHGHQLWHEYHSNESGDPDRVLFHALGGWRLRPGFHDLLWNAAVLIPASQLLQGAVRFWHDQLFCKPALHGGNVAWHQDYSYWTRTKPMQHLTCWIGLDDATEENGCLQYLPGSHRWDLLPVTGLAGDMNGIREVVTDEQWAAFQNPVPIELKAGYASFHHPLLVHGSNENRDTGPRRAVVLNVVKDGVTSQSDSPLLAGVPPISAGQPLSGQFFPLLYDPPATE